MKPVMFCRNTSGMPRRLHSSMKCVTLSADSENSTPLFAMMPTRKPCSRAKPVMTVVGVALLEFVEARSVDHARDDLADVVRLARIDAHDAVELLGVVLRRLGRRHVGRQPLRGVQRGDDRARDPQRIVVVFREVVGDARNARVDVRAAELLGRDLFARGGLHEGRSAEKNRASAFDDDRFVGHGGHVGTARRAGAHDDGDLRNPLGRHPRLVVEDAAEVLAVREDLGLQGQKRAAGIHEIYAGQPVVERDLLRANVLLDGDRIVRAALDGRVVGDDEDLAPADAADAGDEPGAWRVVVVHAVRGERRELEKRRAWIDEQLDALADGLLALLAVAGEVFRAAAFARGRHTRAQLGDERRHAVAIGAVLVRSQL